MKNFYSQFPEVPYKKTSVTMDDVVTFANTLKSKYNIEVIRTAYCMFRNESANGMLGVNNNYSGIQADNAVWEGLPLDNVIGTSVKKDNFGDVRRFIAFNEDGYRSCFEFSCYKAHQRGMYIGAEGITSTTLLAVEYLVKWVGLKREIAKNKITDIENFKSLYKSSTKLIK